MLENLAAATRYSISSMPSIVSRNAVFRGSSKAGFAIKSMTLIS